MINSVKRKTILKKKHTISNADFCCCLNSRLQKDRVNVTQWADWEPTENPYGKVKSGVPARRSSDLENYLSLFENCPK